MARPIGIEGGQSRKKEREKTCDKKGRRRASRRCAEIYLLIVSFGVQRYCLYIDYTTLWFWYDYNITFSY